MNKKLFLPILIISNLCFAKIYRNNPSNSRIIDNSSSVKISKERLSNKMIKIDLLKIFKNKSLKKHTSQIKKKVITYGLLSVPALLTVMKSKTYSDQARWMATFLLGRVVGKKAEKVLIKFTNHPKWVLRLASLRTLFSLNSDKLENVSINLLKDRSWLIRDQALDIINTYSFKHASPFVWSMLYNKYNYNGKNSGNMIKKIIMTVGDLQFKKARKPLLVMSQKKKYNNIFKEIDYSLSKIIGKSSPRGSKIAKQIYWKSIQIKDQTI